MKIRYDKDTDIVYIQFPELKIAESDQEKPDIIPDYAESGQILGIEILHASANMEQVNGILYEVA